MGGSRNARPAGSGGKPDRSAGQFGKVWILENDAPKSLRLRTGATDGSFTEVVGGELSEGTAVLVDIVTEAK